MSRKMFLPKRKEVPAQCASCPFRTDNETEAIALIARLRKSLGIAIKRITKMDVAVMRYETKRTVLEAQGNFACHGTVYRKDGSVAPVCSHRQCKGATEFYRNSDPS